MTIQFSSPAEYPLSFSSSYNQMTSNPFHQNVRFGEEPYTTTSIPPINIQEQTQISVQRTTQVAQSSLWSLPSPRPIWRYTEVDPGCLVANWHHSEAVSGPAPTNLASKQATKYASKAQQNQSDTVLNDGGHSREDRPTKRRKFDLTKLQRVDSHQFKCQVKKLPVPPEPPVAQIPYWNTVRGVPQHPSVSNPQAAISIEISRPTKKRTFDSLEKEGIDPCTPVSISQEKVDEMRNRISQGISLIEQQRYDEGIQLIGEAFLVDNGYQSTRYHLICTLFPAFQTIISKMKPQILQRVEPALALNPQNPEALILRTLCDLEPGKYEIAVEAYRSIVSIDQATLASVRKRMAITELLSDEATNKGQPPLPLKGGA